MSALRTGDHLTPDLIALVAHVAAPLGAPAQAVVAQARAATVESYSPVMLDLNVPDEVPPIPLEDGPTPGRALVRIGDDLVGEILLWIRSNRLIGLEQAWYTHEPPTDWPTPGTVDVA